MYGYVVHERAEHCDHRLCEKVKSIMQKSKIDCTENVNRFTQDVKPIPNINTDKKPDIKKEIYKEKSQKRFVKPNTRTWICSLFLPIQSRFANVPLYARGYAF